MSVYVKICRTKQTFSACKLHQVLREKKSNSQVSGLNMDGQRVGEFAGMGEAEGEQMGRRMGKIRV